MCYSSGPGSRKSAHATPFAADHASRRRRRRGLTGLTVAFRLRQLAPALSVTVLEPRDRPGGNIGTEDHDGFRVEHGPNGFLDRTPSVPNLVRDLGLSDQLIAASEGSRKNRYLFLRGKLRKLPRGPLGLLTTRLLSLRGKWQLLTEPWRPRRPQFTPSGAPVKEESVAQFVTRRAGKRGRRHLRRRARDRHSRRRPGTAQRRGHVPAADR